MLKKKLSHKNKCYYRQEKRIHILWTRHKKGSTEVLRPPQSDNGNDTGKRGIVVKFYQK